MEVEYLPPLAKSPLDSSRGRGKIRTTPRRTTPKAVKTNTKNENAIVVLYLQNEPSQIVECKHVK
jgi:hypothetical protein